MLCNSTTVMSTWDRFTQIQVWVWYKTAAVLTFKASVLLLQRVILIRLVLASFEYIQYIPHIYVHMYVCTYLQLIHFFHSNNNYRVKNYIGAIIRNCCAT